MPTLPQGRHLMQLAVRKKASEVCMDAKLLLAQLKVTPF